MPPEDVKSSCCLFTVQTNRTAVQKKSCGRISRC